MRKSISTFLLVLALMVTVFANEKEERIGRDEAIRTALSYLKMRESDLYVRPDFTEQDVFRLRIVNHLLANPLQSIDYADSLTLSLERKASLKEKLESMASQLDLSLDPPSELPEIEKQTNTGLSKELDIIIDQLKGKVLKAKSLLAEAFINLSDDEMEYLRTESPLLLKEDVRDKDKGIFKLEAERQEGSQKGEKVFDLIKGVRREKIIEAGITVLDGMEGIVKKLDGMKFQKVKKLNLDPKIASGDVWYYEKSPIGDIIVGGTGQTIYKGDFALIIDFGGNDQYLGNAGGNLDGKFPVAISIDLQGRDLYLADRDGAVGAGSLGVGVLVDQSGDDIYQVKNRSLGTGWIGVGFLIDEAGDDKYLGDTFVQGAGFVGAGFLGDYKGNDTYLAAVYSQGFGFVGGFGYIDERQGNDSYLAQSKYTDLFRFNLPRFLTMSQGFGLGYRPDYSGGIGIISEGSGNDTYVADVYGQGASYWYSIGSIVDRGDNDTYKTFDYGQGAGIHISIGTLLDCSGSDDYISKGVSQGEGHDLGVGYLLDKQGNDTYSAYGLSQGAASHHGIGILIDEGGNDGYLSKDKITTHGHGRFSYEYGSLGILLDLEGEDFYSAKGTDNSFWMGTTYGIGIDFPYLSKAPLWPPGEKAEVEKRAYTMDELFTMAKCGYPKFSKLAEYAREQIVANPNRSVPYLISILKERGARERHCVRGLLARIGSPAVEPLIKILKSDNWSEVSLAAQVLGSIGDKRAVEPLIELLSNSPSAVEDMYSRQWQILSAAATALGKIGSQQAVKPLIELLEEEKNQIVRKSIVFTLGQIREPRAIPILVKALSDPYYSVRYPAKDALVKFGGKAVPYLIGNLENENILSRYLTVQALGEIGDGRAVEPLLRLSKTEGWNDPKLRAFVADAVANFPHSREARRALIQLANDDDWFVEQRGRLGLKKTELEGI